MVAPLAGGAPEKLCEGCGTGEWSSDGKRLLYVEHSPDRILVLELASGRSTALVQHATYALHSVSFAPQDRWICFNAVTPGRSRIFVVRVQSVGLVPEPEWIAITNGGWDDQPQWPPDGKLLYFISERDGFRCIWAHRLDPVTKRPLGSAFPIFHAHEAR